MAKDFFISYNKADKEWAEWIAWQLEKANCTTVIQAWDFRPGSNFVLEMQRAATEAQRTIAVLSPDYLSALYTQPEWAAAFTKDPTGEKGTLLPVLVRKCELTGILSPIVYVNLTDCKDPSQAKETLLKGVLRDRMKPKHEPSFPGRENLGLKSSSPPFPGALPPHWNVPHIQNPNFTGREDILKQLRESLVSGKSAALTQAIHGLGGIGKTQIAIQYVYTYKSEYETVWWIRSEDPQNRAGDYASLAAELDLPEKDSREMAVIIEAVKQWLGRHEKWLLVLDNVPESKDITHLLPQGNVGHIIITSRNPNWRGICEPLKIQKWNRDESLSFIKKRTGQDDAKAATTLAEELDYLPLALEQAGAYIEACGKSITEYLELYRTRHKELLRKGERSTNYPDTVATTWNMAFEQLSPEASSILNLCAFLAPDEIPWDLFLKQITDKSIAGALQGVFTDPLLCNEALSELRKYSLIESKGGKLSLHRLVQAVTRDRLSNDRAKELAETALGIIDALFPYDSDDVRTWPECALLVSHAQAVIASAEELDFRTMDTVHLLNQVAVYFQGLAQYSFAESLLRRSLSIYEQRLGADHPFVAISLNNLAGLLENQGKYTEAEPLFRRALSIDEKKSGADHPDVATALNNLALLLRVQGKYTEAEPLFRRSLSIMEQRLGTDHPKVATSLNNLALLLQTQGKYIEAEPLYRRSLSIMEQRLGADHPDVAIGLNNLAALLHAQGKYTEAEPLFRRSLSIDEKKFGADHTNVATSLSNLAGLLEDQGKYKEAEPLYRRSLSIREQRLGADHPKVATGLNNLAGLLENQGKYTEAEPLFRRALSIDEKKSGADHPDVATALNNLALLLRVQGKYTEAEPLFRRSLSIREQRLGADHPKVATGLNNLAGLLENQGKYTEAEPLFRRALSIMEQRLGADHPDVAIGLNNLAALLHAQGKYTEAEPLFRRSLSIDEKKYGADHHEVAISLSNLAALLRDQGKYTEAEPLYRRSLSIMEQRLGADHPDTVVVRKNLQQLMSRKKT